MSVIPDSIRDPWIAGQAADDAGDIGLATEHKFADAGATILICGRDVDKLEEACKQARAKGYSFVAWTRCAASEFSDQGVSFTTINMPLVRTPMIAPTGLYNNVPTLSPEEAADLVAQACIFKPVRIATRLGIAGQQLHAVLPRVAQIAMNTSFRQFPDSGAAKGAKPGEKPVKQQLSPEAMAMQQMMGGFHF